jgi:hypothetical protein
MPIVSDLREVIGALQSEVEFEAAVRELGAAGIDRARIGFLAQEEIAVSCAGAVGCDIKQLPRIEIGLSDDRQQVRTLATSLAATVASFAGAGAVLATMGGAAAPAMLAGLAAGGGVGGLVALFGRRHDARVHVWAESQILNGGIVVIVHPASAEQFEAATAIMRRHCGADVFATPSAWQRASPLTHHRR